MKLNALLRSLVPFALTAVLLLGISLLETGCANIVPPGGGPKDSLPPVLIRALPADSSLNVQRQRITLEFDEFIDLKNPGESVLISPLPEKLPTIEARLRTVSIRLKDSLLPNTTYIIDFGNHIADLNEGNKMKGLQYVFSTGSRIDTNSLSGRVIIAETGKTDSTMIVMLHTSDDDSAVAKQKPRYISRVDAQGNFSFGFLPEGKFYLYALKDADGDKRYSQVSELFAFADSAVVFPGSNDPVMLFAYATEKETRRTPPAAAAPATGPKRLRYSNNLESGRLDLTDSLELNFTTPLKKFDNTRVQLTIDSFEQVKDYKVVYDTARKSLLLHTTWKEGAQYRLLLGDDFAEDTSGLKPAKADTLAFSLKRKADYGTVRIRFQNLDTAQHPVLLFYINNEVTQRFPLRGNEWYTDLFKPGKYELGILLDDNRNGRWDPGVFFGTNKKQPERVIPLKMSLTVKSNWDNELKIDLKQADATGSRD